MKIYLKVILLLSFIALKQSFAQSWFQQQSGTDTTLSDVFFLNKDTGFVCGTGWNSAIGIILKTTNGGVNWVVLDSNIADGLNVIRFLNSNIGFASGAHDGTLLKTFDGGSTWNNIGPNLPNRYNGGMWFTNADTGLLAVGGSNFAFGNSKILKTQNGGITWDTVYSGASWINYFFFTGADNGYATATGGLVLKTTDAGNNWSVIPVGGNYWMSGIYFLNKDTGFAGGGAIPGPGGAIWKTTDGGSNWQSVNTTNGTSKIFFADANTGYGIIGYPGPLIKTTDAGSIWNNEPTPKEYLRGGCFTSAGNGYAVGDSGVIIKYGIATSIKNIESDNVTISVYPNPFNSLTTIQFNTFVNNAVLNIYNIYGQKIKTIIHILGDKIKIERDNVNTGIYFYHLTQNNNNIATGKLIITN